MPHPTPLSLLVIAGGRSRRMGTDKALLRVPTTGLPMILHIIERLHPIGYQEVIVVANNPETIRVAEAAGATTRTDLYPDAGPLGGLATGLAACAGWAAVVACDMPLVRANLFNRLAQMAAEENDPAGECDAVIPHVGGHVEVMHALYHRRCASRFSECVENGTLAVRSCLEGIRVRWVYENEIVPIDPMLESFVSVNTPEEWAAARRRLEAGA